MGIILYLYLHLEIRTGLERNRFISHRIFCTCTSAASTPQSAAPVPPCQVAIAWTTRLVVLPRLTLAVLSIRCQIIRPSPTNHPDDTVRGRSDLKEYACCCSRGCRQERRGGGRTTSQDKRRRPVAIQSLACPNENRR